ncbi:MAG: AAA family ATPase [Bacteroidales bacterium]|nr:AAA family ATPase [Candidatus Scybalocola fimicaballi]
MSITKEMMKDYMEKGKIYDWKSYVTAIAEYIKNNYDIQIEEQQNINKKYVFIIDEINRGEISKIFGELFFSIDPGYRGKKGKVRTQYANMQSVPNEFDEALGITDTNNYGHFYIPENVYIIGTMNDIDRSVESMDFAFRRRFAFKEVTAEDSQSMFDNEEVWKDKDGNLVKPDIVDLKNRMDKLNNAISQIDGLSSAYHIGGSYFLKLNNYDGNSDEKFKKLWDYHIEGLLREYLRGNPDIENLIPKLKAAYNNTNKDVSSENNG